MTNRWKLKTSSSNILLVLILVKAEWVKAEIDNSFDYTNSLDRAKDDSIRDQTSIYVGNDEIAQYFFNSSQDNSTILGGLNKCLDNFQLITCMKMLLLDRINDATGLMLEPSVRDADVRFLNGLLVFKIKNGTMDSGPGDISDGLSLDEEITAKVKRIFWGRSLLVTLLPNFQIEIEPARGKVSDFICFNYTIRRNLESTEDDEEFEGRRRKKKRRCGNNGSGNNGNGDGNGDDDEDDDDDDDDDVDDDGDGDDDGSDDGGGKRVGKRRKCSGGNRRRGSGNGNRNGNGNRGGSRGGGGKKKKKGGKGGGMSMMMMIPQILMMGLMPFTLASLKSMVMNAVMVTMMALNGAIFMTIRNMVFGPRKGDNVMYVNYGYDKEKEPKMKRPVLIIHSPAAFVKQPPVPRKPFYGPQNAPQHSVQGHGDFSHAFHNGNGGGPWENVVGNSFHESGGSSTFFQNENSGNFMQPEAEYNFGDNKGSSSVYQIGNAEVMEADVIDAENVTSVNHYYTVPQVQNQNRRRWQGIRRPYRPRVKHFLKIRRKTI